MKLFAGTSTLAATAVLVTLAGRGVTAAAMPNIIDDVKGWFVENPEEAASLKSQGEGLLASMTELRRRGMPIVTTTSALPAASTAASDDAEIARKAAALAASFSGLQQKGLLTDKPEPPAATGGNQRRDSVLKQQKRNADNDKPELHIGVASPDPVPTAQKRDGGFNLGQLMSEHPEYVTLGLSLAGQVLGGAAQTNSEGVNTANPEASAPPVSEPLKGAGSAAVHKVSVMILPLSAALFVLL